MLRYKTYLDKCNTIVKDNPVNTGLNPVMELNYSKMVSRMLVHFDHSRLKAMHEDGTYPDLSKLRHTLKMTNCGSIDVYDLDRKHFNSINTADKLRAVSFDLIFFLLPQDWDNGRGFDFVRDIYVKENRSISFEGSNWYQARNGYKWDEEGVYSNARLSKELDRFSSLNGNMSKIIIGTQHFDYGFENIEIDITETVNRYIKGEIDNHGIGIAFSPMLENDDSHEYTQYVGFFSKFTNTFFEPFVDTVYCETIEDDRNSFYLDKPNRLYLFCENRGFPFNLDELPTCIVNGSEIASKQATKGVYYAEVELSSDEVDSEQILSDTWTNLKYNGKNLKDVELDFEVKGIDGFMMVGSDTVIDPKKYDVTIRGIQYSEEIQRGDVRKVIVEANIPYTTGQSQSIDGMEYRLYVREGTRELDIYPWTKVNRTATCNYFLIDTNCLLPNRYYIDIKTTSNLETRQLTKTVKFDIMNDVTEVYT